MPQRTKEKKKAGQLSVAFFIIVRLRNSNYQCAATTQEVSSFVSNESFTAILPTEPTIAEDPFCPTTLSTT